MRKRSSASPTTPLYVKIQHCELGDSAPAPSPTHSEQPALQTHTPIRNCTSETRATSISRLVVCARALISRSTASLTSKSAMAFPDLSSTRPGNITRPPLNRHKTSATHSTVMREIIRPWADLSATPPGCRAVSFSSWTRVSPGNGKKQSDDMKASVLCAGKGTAPDFNPPLLERAYLGVDQPSAGGQPEVVQYERRGAPRWQKGSPSSWSTENSDSIASINSACSATASSEPITFRKMEIKTSPSPPSSLLTAYFSGSLPQVDNPPKPCITEVNESYPELCSTSEEFANWNVGDGTRIWRNGAVFLSLTRIMFRRQQRRGVGRLGNNQ
jgi:hypothetical protein